jgi:hypothetical protein
MMGSRNKILGSGVTAYLAYLDTLVSLFRHFLTLKAATSVKMSGYLQKLNQLFRLDILYQLVPQLILFDFYFLRYVP